jgi:hypothetical protein
VLEKVYGAYDTPTEAAHEEIQQLRHLTELVTIETVRQTVTDQPPADRG